MIMKSARKLTTLLAALETERVFCLFHRKHEFKRAHSLKGADQTHDSTAMIVSESLSSVFSILPILELFEICLIFSRYYEAVIESIEGEEVSVIFDSYGKSAVVTTIEFIKESAKAQESSSSFK